MRGLRRVGPASTGDRPEEFRAGASPAVGPRLWAAGAAAGLAGFAVFLALHTWWIAPIWDILGFGGGFAVAGGTAVAWAFQEARGRLPRGLGGAAALGGILLATMLPAQLAVLVRGGIPLVAFANVPGTWIGYLMAELLVTAALVGAGAGWWLTRRARGVAAWAIAGGLFGWTVGHNLPFLGAGRTHATVLALILIPTAFSVVTFWAVAGRGSGP